MKLKRLKIKKLKKHIPTILSVGACVGVIFTAIASSKAAVKAEKEETTAGKVKCYIWTIVVAGTTIIGIIGADHINRKQKAGLIAACALLEKRLREYQTGVKEVLGEDAHQQVMDHIVKEKCNPVDVWHPGLVGACVLVPNNLSEPEVVRTFYDCYSQRYFESTLSKVLEAEFTLNRDYNLGGEVCINDLYDLYGIPKIEGGDKLVWDQADGIYSIDFNHPVTKLDDGMEVLWIEMPFGPMPAED